MKWILLAAIRLYWRVTPPERRRTCIFRETCSRHVYRLTKEQGLLGGLGALLARVRRCRPGFVVLHPAPTRPEAIVMLRDGSTLLLSELALNLGGATIRDD